jgi:hypothetical protein
MNMNAQVSYETYSTDPSSSTVRRTLEKQDISYRLGIGASTIVPVFEGDKWEEDARNAVKYAIQLIEECIPTTYPIKIKFVRNLGNPSQFVNTTVRFIDNYPENGCYGFDGRYARIPNNHGGSIYYSRVPSASLKRYAAIGTEKYLFHQQKDLLFNDYDGTVIFSTNDIFSTRTDGTVEAGKYDLTTVAIREIIKILGVASTANRNSSNSLSLLWDNNMVSVYDCNLFSSNDIGLDLANGIAVYNLSTSNNLFLKPYSNLGYESYKIYAPSTFVLNKSLNYLDRNDNDLETLLFQPDLPKETSLLKISGKAFQHLIISIDWGLP